MNHLKDHKDFWENTSDSYSWKTNRNKNKNKNNFAKYSKIKTSKRSFQSLSAFPVDS